MQPAQNRTIFMRVFLGGICLFFALIGNVMGKVRRNFWMGVRTPWTLASEPVWNQTHRLAAWLFVAAGLVGFVLVMLLPPDVVWVALLVLIPAGLVPVVYSLVLYKRLERQGKLEPPADNSPEVCADESSSPPVADAGGAGLRLPPGRGGQA
jgi:hypothetical protein